MATQPANPTRKQRRKATTVVVDQAAVRALMSQVAQLQSQAAVASGRTAQPSVVRRKNKKGRQRARDGSDGAGVPAGARTKLAFVGMRDKRELCSSYTAGYVWVGDGTSGAANAVLFQTYAGTLLVGTSAANPPVIPILPGDSVLGRSYMTDEAKHYNRRRYRRLLLHIDSFQPNTNAAMVLVVAPVRGSALCNAAYPQPKATAALTGATMDNARSMSGNQYLNSFDDKKKRTTIDLTPYIAGGSGPKQNEFAINAANGTGTTAFVVSQSVQTTIGSVTENSPCGFLIAGLNTVAGNAATQMFEIIVELEYDLLDFVGSTALPSPIG